MIKINKDNKINILDIDFFYKEGQYWAGDDYGSWVYFTNFYALNGFTEELKWSWKKFRKIPTGKQIPNYDLAFVLNFWITVDTSKSKDEVRTEVEEKAKTYKEKFEKKNKRAKELKLKELI